MNKPRTNILASWGIGSRLFYVVAACAFMTMAQVDAEVRVRGEHGTSKRPYWEIGRLDKALTSACQRGEFKQRKYVTYSVGFVGDKGRGLTGIAVKNWNLIDPKGLAKEGVTYHFFNQGYSNCKVYVAPTPQ